MDHTRAKQPGAHHITEIEGLRGIALSLVVLFHLFGGGRVSGGIDVFLVISGFLLTGSTTRRIERGAPFLLEHFSRVARRLVPSAAVVVVFVALAALLVFPESRWLQTGRELIASLLYFENWELISSQLAYGAAGVDSSPLQHFWSLSVQGQFFLAWPLALVIIAFAARAAGVKPFYSFVIATALVTIASFAYSIMLVNADQSVAYLSTWTRLWELGVGAILALTATKIPLPLWARSPLAWLGLTLIVTCGFAIDGATAFPGILTLWPVLGTALVIVSAGGTSRFSPVHVVDTRVITFLARISYPLYLWHWPLLIVYLEYRHYDAVGWKGAALVLSASVLLAWLTQRFVAEPLVLTQPPKNHFAPFVVPASIVATVAILLSIGVGAIERSNAAELAAAEKAAQASTELYPGARALTDGIEATDPTVGFVPSTEIANADLPDLYSRGCVQNYRSEPGMDEVLICEDEDTTDPSHFVVMSGGSHVLHWYPALKTIATEENWRLEVVDKDGCRLTVRADETNFAPSEMCYSWNDNALPALVEMAPDAVFTVGTRTPETDGVEIVHPGQVGAWQYLADADIPVIAMRDTPRFTSSVPECLDEHDDNPLACARDRSEIFLDRAPYLDTPNIPESTVFIDLTDSFCTAESCDPIVGNILAYRDEDHMTATYSRTLVGSLRAELEAQAGWLF
ncbi:acyltransferase [Salinibacterium sp. SWN1162]|nr:acyltransferase [Salinibacterium sp. SWN1162]